MKPDLIVPATSVAEAVRSVVPPRGVLEGKTAVSGPPPRSRYLDADIFGVQVARMYSNHFEKPFFAVVGEYEGYDIRAVDGAPLIEVKYETTPRRTGQVALEFWNTDLDRASGVLGTRADLWFHVYETSEGVEAVEYQIDVLRRLIVEQGVVKSNGRNALIKIISVSQFRERANRIVDLDPLIFKKLLKEKRIV